MIEVRWNRVLDRLLGDRGRQGGLRGHLWLLPELVVVAISLTFHCIVAGGAFLFNRERRGSINGFHAIHTHNRLLRENGRERPCSDDKCAGCSIKCETKVTI